MLRKAESTGGRHCNYTQLQAHHTVCKNFHMQASFWVDGHISMRCSLSKRVLGYFAGPKLAGPGSPLQALDLHVDGHVALRLQLHGQALLLQARLQARQDGRHLPRALRQVAAQLARAGLHACRSWEGSGKWVSNTSPRHRPSAGRPQVRLSASWACERPAVTQGRACQAL